MKNLWNELGSTTHLVLIAAAAVFVFSLIGVFAALLREIP